MKSNTRFVSLLFVSSILLTQATRVIAQAPATMSYQGLLTDATGTPVSGNYNLIFRLYNAASGGTQVWSETQNGVIVVDGVYNVVVGKNTPLSSIDFNNPLWFEVRVNGVVQSPRTPLSGIPYSLGVRLPLSTAVSTAGSAFAVRNAASNGSGIYAEGQTAGVTGQALLPGGGTTIASGVVGETNSPAGQGVFGIATGAAANSGVLGRTSSQFGAGVRGEATAGVGENFGVYGTTASEDGYAIRGIATATIGWASGVYGTSNSTGGNGVFGFADAASGTTTGVKGIVSSPSGLGVFGHAQAFSGLNYGVYGRSNSGAGYGVFGENLSSSGTGIYGLGPTIGVLARSTGSGGVGLLAFADGSGNAIAISGSSGSVSGKGVSGNGATGVFGETTYASGRAVWGKASSFPGLNYGVFGETVSPDGYSGYFVGGIGVFVNNSLGIGASNPQGYIHVLKDASFAKPQLLLEENSTNDFSRIRMKNTTNALFWDVAAGGTTNDALNFFREGVGDILSLRSTQRVGVNNGSPGHPLHVGTNNANGNGAHVTAGGAWTNGSSRNFKEDFEPVNVDEILAGIAGLPISRWRYAGGTEGSHIGPIAEDFAAAFGTGSDDRYISTVDADGVALAAIQALHRRQEGELRRLEALVVELTARVAELESAQ